MRRHFDARKNRNSIEPMFVFPRPIEVELCSYRAECKKFRATLDLMRVICCLVISVVKRVTRKTTIVKNGMALGWTILGIHLT